MRCENIFCIYFSNKKCILDEISLDIQGTCENCIYVDIDEEVLEKKRILILEYKKSPNYWTKNQ